LGFGYITLATVGFIVIFAILLIIGCFHRLLSGHPDKEKHG
jgi:hypothetical protein